MQIDDTWINQSINTGTLVHVMKRKNDLIVPMHSHTHIEIVYVLSGHMTQVINSNKYNLERGDLIFLNSGEAHSFTADEACTYVNVLFMPELIVNDRLTRENAFSYLALTNLRDIGDDIGNGKISFGGKDRSIFENLILTMLDEYTERPPLWQNMLLDYLNVMITQLCRKIESGLETNDLDDMWQKLSEYIDSNISQKLSLTELASRCFYTPNYFSKIFKDRFGMSMTEYITRKRLDRATDLLINTDISIDDIAAQVGFADRSSFYHVFSKYFEVTPAQYRAHSSSV